MYFDNFYFSKQKSKSLKFQLFVFERKHFCIVVLIPKIKYYSLKKSIFEILKVFLDEYLFLMQCVYLFIYFKL